MLSLMQECKPTLYWYALSSQSVSHCQTLNITCHRTHSKLYYVAVASARNGYPGRYPLPGYPVRTRVPGNFYYPVAVHSTLPAVYRLLRRVINSTYHKSTGNLRANCKTNCTTHHRLAYYGVVHTAYLLIDYPK